MNLIFRFLWLTITSPFATKLDLFAVSTLKLRVLPTDCDLYLHMNNGRYFTVMDLGRLNLIYRSGTYSRIKKSKLYPVIASEMIRFRKSLNMFVAYELSSRLMGWDDKYLYHEQIFHVNHDIHAIAIVRIRFLSPQGKPVDTKDLSAVFGVHSPSPPLPSWLIQWQSAEMEFYLQTKKS